MLLGKRREMQNFLRTDNLADAWRLVLGEVGQFDQILSTAENSFTDVDAEVKHFVPTWLKYGASLRTAKT